MGKLRGARLSFPLRSLLVAAAAGLVAVTFLLSSDDDLDDRRAGRSAEEFVASVGVNVHLSYYDTAYRNGQGVLLRLRELGVHHIRDGLAPGPPEHHEALRTAARQGIRSTLITGVDTPPERITALVRTNVREAVEALESPNEYDGSGDPSWPETLRAYVKRLSLTLKQSGVRLPLIGPSFINVDSREMVGDLPPAYDFSNTHPYPGGRAPEEAIGDELAALIEHAGDSPVVVTETGYHNAMSAPEGHPPTSEGAAAIYLPRLVLEHFRLGVRRTFIYELVDELPDTAGTNLEQHFGLLRSDLSPKPAFTALKNLLGAVHASPGEADGEAPDVHVEARVPVRQVLLYRTDGSRVLALWRPVAVWDPEHRQGRMPAHLPVALRFEEAPEDLAIYRPSRDEAPEEHSAVGRLPLQLGADVVLVSFR